MLTRVGAIALLLLVSACDHEPAVTSFPPDAYPERLSEWGIVTASGNLLELGRDVLPYDLATPLFTDHAHKLRTVWMPPGARARYSATDVFDLPVGTILSKTFYYPRAEGLPSSGVEAVVQTEDTSGEFLEDGLNLGQVRLIETRLLVRQSDGWDALPYVWDEAQGDAFLRIAGALVPLQTADDGGHASAFPYLVPTRNECASCHASDHTSGALHPIGPAARHLNKDYAHYADGSSAQLPRWVVQGYLDHAPADAPANAVWRAGATDDLERRARSYLDINCGHCHSPTGAADTSGLHLDRATTDPTRLGICKPPIAAGRGSGGHTYSIVPGAPDASILTYRMSATDPAIMMPEIGRATAHAAGVALIRRWIETLPGACLPQHAV